MLNTVDEEALCCLSAGKTPLFSNISGLLILKEKLEGDDYLEHCEKSAHKYFQWIPERVD